MISVRVTINIHNKCNCQPAERTHPLPTHVYILGEPPKPGVNSHHFPGTFKQISGVRRSLARRASQRAATTKTSLWILNRINLGKSSDLRKSLTRKLQWDNPTLFWTGRLLRMDDLGFQSICSPDCPIHSMSYVCQHWYAATVSPKRSHLAF